MTSKKKQRREVADISLILKVELMLNYPLKTNAKLSRQLHGNFSYENEKPAIWQRNIDIY